MVRVWLPCDTNVTVKGRERDVKLLSVSRRYVYSRYWDRSTSGRFNCQAPKTISGLLKLLNVRCYHAIPSFLPSMFRNALDVGKSGELSEGRGCGDGPDCTRMYLLYGSSCVGLIQIEREGFLLHVSMFPQYLESCNPLRARIER
jgi:hypothetical protein